MGFGVDARKPPKPKQKTRIIDKRRTPIVEDGDTFAAINPIDSDISRNNDIIK